MLYASYMILTEYCPMPVYCGLADNRKEFTDRIFSLIKHKFKKNVNSPFMLSLDIEQQLSQPICP